jgi:hypothetical protein
MVTQRIGRKNSRCTVRLQNPINSRRNDEYNSSCLICGCSFRVLSVKCRDVVHRNVKCQLQQLHLTEENAQLFQVHSARLNKLYDQYTGQIHLRTREKILFALVFVCVSRN